MKAHPEPIAEPPEPPESGEPEEIPLSRLFTDEDELTDEEAFYLAQEAAFASLRARYEARLRREI